MKVFKNIQNNQLLVDCIRKIITFFIFSLFQYLFFLLDPFNLDIFNQIKIQCLEEEISNLKQQDISSIKESSEWNKKLFYYGIGTITICVSCALLYLYFQSGGNSDSLGDAIVTSPSFNIPVKKPEILGFDDGIARRLDFYRTPTPSPSASLDRYVSDNSPEYELGIRALILPLD